MVRIRSPRVTIILLNWNGWKDTIECLESLYMISYSNYELIIVDNGSDDNSVEMIRRYARGEIEIRSEFLSSDSGIKTIEIIELDRVKLSAEDGGARDAPPGKRLILIKNEANFGFAEGNNIAIEFALRVLNPEYILLLNNDTVVEREFLSELVSVAEIDKRIGFVGPKIYYYDFGGRHDILNFAGGKLNMWTGQGNHIGFNEIDKGQYDQIRSVDYVEGSCLLIRKEVLEGIGLLDPNYFAYWEENDLCMRGLRRGYSSVYVPSARIWHKVSASSKNKRKYYYQNRNIFIFMKRHASRPQFLTFLLYFFIIKIWLICITILVTDADPKSFQNLFRGLLDGVRYIKN